jgi:ABC-type sugar transport system permease subunit
MKVIRVIVGIVFCLTIYLLPAGVAILRNRKNTGAIFTVDLFLGWTLVGWVVALAWAVATEDSKAVA